MSIYTDLQHALTNRSIYFVIFRDDDTITTIDFTCDNDSREGLYAKDYEEGMANGKGDGYDPAESEEQWFLNEYLNGKTPKSFDSVYIYKMRF